MKTLQKIMASTALSLSLLGCHPSLDKDNKDSLPKVQYSFTSLDQIHPKLIPNRKGYNGDVYFKEIECVDYNNDGQMDFVIIDNFGRFLYFENNTLSNE